MRTIFQLYILYQPMPRKSKTGSSIASLFFLLLLPFGAIRCTVPGGDPASSILSILHKRPASFHERLVALDALVRRYQGLEPHPEFAESLTVQEGFLKKQLQGMTDPEAKMAALKSFVFDTLKLQPESGPTGLDLSLPSRVLEDRKGSCVGLSLLFLAYAEAVDLPLRPVFLPSHVTLSLDLQGKTRFLETLKPTLERDSAFYAQTFLLAKRPWYASLSPQPPEAALQALIFNFANALNDQGQLEWAQDLYRLVNQSLPRFPEAAGNLGLLLHRKKYPDQARPWLDTAMAGDTVGGQKALSLLRSSSH